MAAISHRLGLLAVWAQLALPVAQPADLHIAVELEGAEAPPITRARLARMTPAYDDGQRRGFAVGEFFGWLYQRPDIALEALDRAGRVTRFETRGRKLLLVVDADGAARVAVLDPGLVVVTSAVVRLRLVLAPAAGPPLAPPELALALDGKSRPPWRLEDLGPPSIDIAGDGGAKRAGWSLRELLEQRLGARARLIAVTAGETVTIDAADWNDRTRIPVLRLNRRHAFRLQWISRDGSPAPGPSVRNVTALQILVDKLPR